jgi:hypothetical protein
MVWYAGKVENKKFSITKGILQDPQFIAGFFLPGLPGCFPIKTWDRPLSAARYHIPVIMASASRMVLAQEV